MKEKLDKLYEKFDIRQKPGGGGYKYAVARDVVDRMNRTFEGRWSTEVMSQEVIEDNIIVRVRVCVHDGEKVFCHDGFGSSQVARFTSGTNQGKAINLGNNFKSAKSIAIKDACAKWGAGLYLEDVDEEGNNNAGMPGPSPTIPAKPQEKKPEPAANTAAFPPFNIPSAPKAPPKEEIKEEPKAELPKVPVPTMGAVKPEEKQAHTSLTEETVTADSITDVQKIAIQSLLTLKNLEFDKLAVDALGREDNIPKDPNGLNYQDAVTIIKYGNDINKA